MEAHPAVVAWLVDDREIRDSLTGGTVLLADPATVACSPRQRCRPGKRADGRPDLGRESWNQEYGVLWSMPKEIERARARSAPSLSSSSARAYEVLPVSTTPLIAADVTPVWQDVGLGGVKVSWPLVESPTGVEGSLVV